MDKKTIGVEEKMAQYDRAFTEIHNALISINNTVNLVMADRTTNEVKMRQFCVQAAALACQVQGGDVVRVASQIEDYVMGFPNNVVSLQKMN